MTTEQQRIAIATACGWSPLKAGASHIDADVWYKPTGGRILKGRDTGIMKRGLPNYPNSLDAMAEAEKVLGKDGQSHEYWKHLCHCCRVSWDGNVMWVAVFATAAQRAEAFLRTLGRWVE